MTKEDLRKHIGGLIKINAKIYWHGDFRDDLKDRIVLLLEVHKFPAHQHQHPRNACVARLKRENDIIAPIDVVLEVFVDNEKLKLGVNYNLIEIVK